VLEGHREHCEQARREAAPAGSGGHSNPKREGATTPVRCRCKAFALLVDPLRGKEARNPKNIHLRYPEETGYFADVVAGSFDPRGWSIQMEHRVPEKGGGRTDLRVR
jgi:hypothetical protein